MLNEKEYRSIYREAFSEPDTDFEDLLFEYCAEYVCEYKAKGETASMLFALPCKLKWDKEERKGIYIYAAATLEKYRGRGYMSKLIKGLKVSKGEFQLLRPANTGLVDFYKKSGFSEINAVSDSVSAPQILPLGGFAKLVDSIPDIEDKNPFLAMQKGLDCFSEIYFPYSME